MQAAKIPVQFLLLVLLGCLFSCFPLPVVPVSVPQEALIGPPVKYVDTVFKDEFNDSGRVFQQIVNFKETTFSDGVDFTHSVFNRNVNFDSVAFSETTDFESAVFKQAANFQLATFHDDAGFDSVVFRRDADFSGTDTFLQNADFTAARFLRSANFSFLTFLQTVDFSYAAFMQRVDFSNLTFSESSRLCFDHATLPDTLIFCNDVGIPQDIDLSPANYSDSLYKDSGRITQIFIYKSDFSKFSLSTGTLNCYLLILKQAKR